MASIKTVIELQDAFSGQFEAITSAVNAGIPAMDQLAGALNQHIDTSPMQAVEAQLSQTTAAAQALDDAMQSVSSPSVSSGDAAQQIEEIEARLSKVSQMQEAINGVARSLYVLPEDAAKDVVTVNREIERMQAALDFLKTNPFDLDSSVAEAQIKAMSDALDGLTEKQQNLDAVMGNAPSQAVNVDVNPVVPDPLVETPAPVQVPVEWQSDSLEVFTNTGVERFQSEIQSVNSMMNTLNETQNRIAAQAGNTNIFPQNMVADMNGVNSRLQAIQARIEQIENNPINLGSDAANAQLEQLRARLHQAISEQEALNNAVDGIDVQAANEAYLRLSNTIGGTERYIRDNVDEQGRFNQAIQEGANKAFDLQSTIAKALGAFAGIAGIRKAFNFIEQTTTLFDTQLNAETQLISVLSNMLDADYVAQFEIETSADTSGAIADIMAIQSSVDTVEVPVSAETQALTAAFDTIKEKAAEIQSRGIYGDEAIIAGAAEFATYFSDTDAITTMMDTLADYAMGMSGGGEIDASAMVDYATNLGKIMSGSYDAMTKKGFEFTDAQKAIIEGTATQAQIVETLGEEYLAMSDEMQAAAAISQVIDESWSGLYESMSNTPQGKIIQLNNAWGDMQEIIGGRLYPFIMLMVDAVINNWPTIEAVIGGITTGLEYLLGVLSWLVEGAINFAQAIADNWSWISPIIYGIIGALAVYGAYLAIIKGIEIASAAVKGALAVAEGIHAVAIWATTTATWAEVAAQQGLNGAMYACPVVWILIMIIAIIAAIYAVCAAIAKMTGIANSGFGVITGGINVVIEFFKNLGLEVANIALGIWNALSACAQNVGTAFNNVISGIQSWFYGLLSTVLNVVAGIASALNALPFVEFDYSGIVGKADEYAAKAAEAAGNKQDYTSISDAFSSGMNTFDTFQNGWAGNAFQAGAAWGDGVADSVSSALDGFFDPSSLFGTTDIPSPEDYAGALVESSDLGANVGDIAGSTGSIAQELSDTTEELKYLRDIAEQEAINRFTTAEIRIEQHNQNNISSDMDLDGIADYMTDAVEEAVIVATEGVHV